MAGNFGIIQYTDIESGKKIFETGIDNDEFFIKAIEDAGPDGETVLYSWGFNRLTGQVTINGKNAIPKPIVFELNFGNYPVRCKVFEIENADVTTESIISVIPSGKVAAGRIGNDWEWDSIQFSVRPADGKYYITANASGLIKGKRSIICSIN